MNSFSQRSIYIKPFVEKKSGFASTNSSLFSDYVFQNNDLFHYDNISVSNMFDNPSFNLGISFGFVSQNKRNILELSYVKDGTILGYNLHTFTEFLYINNPPSVKSVFPNKTGASFGYQFSRFGLTLNHQLLKDKSYNQKVFISYGINFASYMGKLFYPQSYYMENNLGENKKITEYSKINNIYNSNFLFNIGFSCEIHTSKAYLFDLSFFTTKSILNKNLSQIVTKIEIYENQALINSYTFFGYSKGSGLYLQLSRKLQFYPWKKKKYSS
jgi:hypothetical protein